MAVKASRALVDLILLGPTGDRRQLQDSPILGDVWMKFASRPAELVDLLIAPEQNFAAGPVALAIAEEVQRGRANVEKNQASAEVAYLQGFIAARVTFRELLQVLVPMTVWWKERKVQEALSSREAETRLRECLSKIIEWARHRGEEDEEMDADSLQDFERCLALDRFTALAGVILWAGSELDNQDNIITELARLESPDPIVTGLQEVFMEIFNNPPEREAEGRVWQISLNRRARAALEKSVPAVKGDAARTLFKVKCKQITWAILDSGIDATHPAFLDEPDESGGPAKSRVVAAYDFSNIRKIVSLDNLNSGTLKERAEELRKGREKTLTQKNAMKFLKALAEDADNDRPVHWELVEEFIRIDAGTPPKGGHGTHVAGIIGGRGGKTANGISFPDGMCPDIKLYDFRVLSKSTQDTEFAIIAALQFIRYLNERNGFIRIHGANLSLSIPHDVRNFACGRTPICDECERLVNNGVVVVAAAGNMGYHSFETANGSYEGYAAFSITDPGNADGVITVGATHRFWPHTYGVSFFSSRGPTGDGRLKPDIVAPGERIQSCLPNQDWGAMDGTSMAAPHVSGAAAMLMARYSELIGFPRRIKDVLCKAATDLGRERTFQGHGMLDVLRALQEI